MGCRFEIYQESGSNSGVVGFKFSRCRVQIQELSGLNSAGVGFKFRCRVQNSGVGFKIQEVLFSNSEVVRFKFRRHPVRPFRVQQV